MGDEEVYNFRFEISCRDEKYSTGNLVSNTENTVCRLMVPTFTMVSTESCTELFKCYVAHLKLTLLVYNMLVILQYKNTSVHKVSTSILDVYFSTSVTCWLYFSKKIKSRELFVRIWGKKGNFCALLAGT